MSTFDPDIATVRPGGASSGAPGIPAAWRASLASGEFANAVDALEAYKKKDPSKSASAILEVWTLAELPH
jgi:hypothetical protein